AGRKLSAKVLVGTLLATWIGSGSIIASAGLAYNRGLPALWFDAGVWCALVILYLVAGRVRKFGQYTVPDILEARYNQWARVLGTVVTIIAYTAIVSYQFRAGGMVLNLITGLPIETGIIITAVFVILYTVLAGLISVAYTDVVNGIIMTIGLFVALPFLLSNAGGWNEVVNQLPETHFQVLGDLTLLQALAYALPTMLLLLGESGMYQRFFAARDEGAARRAVVGWIIGTIIIETLIVFLAVIGSALYQGIESEMVILYSVKQGVPVLIGCLLLSAIVAVIVSTADSFLLVPATNVMRDIYQRFINPDLSQKKMVLYSRIVVVLLGAIAFVQVSFFERVLEMAIYAYTVYGVGITPAVMAAFFWKRATVAGGIASMASGAVVTILWEVLQRPFDLQTIYPALGLSLVSLVMVSLLSPKPAEEKWKPFFG
ncbi:MAG: sodium:solute symporter family protein, partial [Candidatus Zixiibacteriota bacterium]